jgi:flagellar biosynthesis GTPase FlhF
MYSFKIRELFIFNTNLKSPKKKPSDDEAQDAKLLYYYPENTEILVKRSNIGIIEGTLSFMQAFEKVDSNFLLTELDKTLFIAEGYEENFMVGFILDKENVKTFNKYENLDTKKKWFKELLDNFYNTFVLFHNKFYEFFLDKENPYVNNGLKKEKLFMLNDFIMNYFTFIENMKLPILNNLQYFTMNTNLESELLLAVQRLTEKIPNLKMTSIIYKGKLVHNQLPFSVISILYNIFFSAYECTNKYTKFNNPVLKQHFIENLENNNDSKNENNINKNDKKEEKKEEKKIETKEENKEEKKEEQKEETKDEIKEEKKEQNEIIIEKEKTEENDIKEENKEENEIKEENKTEGEKQENFEPSPYRKILNIKSVKNQFLTGVLIDPTEPNHYDIFIPKIYIKELDFEEYSMIIYLTQGILFFLFFDKDFIIENQIEHITKIPTRITKYFRAQFDNIIKLDRPNLDPNIFCYKNENNKCLKFSGFIKKNLNTFDWKLFESIQKAFFINGDTDMTSIAKIKGFYVYFMNNIGQEIVMLLKDNLTLTQLKQEIEKMKKNYFGNLFLN